MKFDITIAVSLMLGAFGMVTQWMAMGNNMKQRKFAPLVGLSGQLAWSWYAWLLGPKGTGLWILVALYSLVYLRGAGVQWEARRWLWRKFGRPTLGQCTGCGCTLTVEEIEHYAGNCNRCEGIEMQEWDEAA